MDCSFWLRDFDSWLSDSPNITCATDVLSTGWMERAFSKQLGQMEIEKCGGFFLFFTHYYLLEGVKFLSLVACIIYLS